MDKEARLGPEMVLNHTIFFTMIGDEDFFSAVPAFSTIKDAAQEIHRKITDAIVNKDRSCLSCSDIQTSVKPVFVAFVSLVRKFALEDPEALEPLIQYITRRRGYRPAPIRLYFKAQGKVGTLEL